MAERRIAVIGGGISGLAAAYRCRELARERGREIEITVFERTARVGGCIATRYDEGCVLEMGPDSLITEKPAALDLIGRLGLAHELRPMLTEFRGARVVRAGRLVPIPDDFRLFTPTSLAALVGSRLFTPFGIVRAALEPFVPPAASARDESLGSFVSRRFGREILERLAQPLIGGIYSGDPSRLSMQATLPQFLAMERKHGSLVRAMQAMGRNQPPSAAPRMVSLRGGLGSLVASLERELAGSVRTSGEVTELRRGLDGWRVGLADGRNVDVDAVICALPAHAAAPLFEPFAPRTATLLRSIAYHSVATVTMAFATADIPPLPRCTGFVVPQVEGRRVMATTFSSQKYVNRAPEGTTILRAFVGGAMQSEVLQLEDRALLAAVHDEFRQLLGIRVPAQWSIVHRHPDALPEYKVGHTGVIGEIERSVTAIGSMALAGSAYRGAGIADCVASAERAALAVVESLEGANLGVGTKAG